MNLYEVIYYGSHGDGNAEDTIYLVRASDFHSAVIHTRNNLSATDHDGEAGILADVVYEIGIDLTSATSDYPCTLRGPYFAYAYNRGWKSWKRKLEGSEHTDEWIEDENTVV